jgi:hypothetical protein
MTDTSWSGFLVNITLSNLTEIAIECSGRKKLLFIMKVSIYRDRDCPKRRH